MWWSPGQGRGPSMDILNMQNVPHAVLNSGETSKEKARVLM